METRPNKPTSLYPRIPHILLKSLSRQQQSTENDKIEIPWIRGSPHFEGIVEIWFWHEPMYILSGEGALVRYCVVWCLSSHETSSRPHLHALVFTPSSSRPRLHTLIFTPSSSHPRLHTLVFTPSPIPNIDALLRICLFAPKTASSSMLVLSLANLRGRRRDSVSHSSSAVEVWGSTWISLQHLYLSILLNSCPLIYLLYAPELFSHVFLYTLLPPRLRKRDLHDKTVILHVVRRFDCIYRWTLPSQNCGTASVLPQDSYSIMRPVCQVLVVWILEPLRRSYHGWLLPFEGGWYRILSWGPPAAINKTWT